jgi:hypothetical protein
MVTKSEAPMKRLSWVLALGVLATGGVKTVSAAHISGFYNTGVCGGANTGCTPGTLLAPTTQDFNWQYLVYSSPTNPATTIYGWPQLPLTNPSGAGNPYVVDSGGPPGTPGSAGGVWLGPDTNSAWLSPVYTTSSTLPCLPSGPTTTGCGPGHPGDVYAPGALPGSPNYVAQTSFTFGGSGSYTMEIKVAVDDTFALLLNGIQISSCSTNTCLSNMTTVNVTSGLVQGTNTLTLDIFDNTNLSPTGFRVEDDFVGTNDVAPEPGTWVLLAAGLAAVFLMRRRSLRASE